MSLNFQTLTKDIIIYYILDYNKKQNTMKCLTINNSHDQLLILNVLNVLTS